MWFLWTVSTIFTVADLQAFSSADLSLVSTYVDVVWMQALPSVSLLTYFLPLGEQGSNEVPPRRPVFGQSLDGGRSSCGRDVSRIQLRLFCCFLAALSLLLFPSGVQRSVVLVMESPSFRSTWPIHLQRLFVMEVRSCLLRSRFLVGDFFKFFFSQKILWIFLRLANCSLVG